MGVTVLVPQVVVYSTVGIEIEEMLAQAFGKEPCGDGKVLVMRASQALTVDLGLLQRRSDSGNGVFRGEKVPGLIRSAHEQSAFSSQQSHSATRGAEQTSLHPLDLPQRLKPGSFSFLRPRSKPCPFKWPFDNRLVEKHRQPP